MTQADDYPITIRRTKNGFVAEAASLGLTRTGPDVNALEAEVRNAIDEVLAVCERHNAKIQIPQGQSLESGRPAGFRRSVASAMIVLLAVVIISMPLMWGYQKLSRVVSTSLGNLETSQVLRSVSWGVQKTADSLEMITPQRRDQLAHDFGRIARALEPYANQLRPLLVTPVDARDGERRP